MDELQVSEKELGELYKIHRNLGGDTIDTRFLAIKDGESYWQVYGRGYIAVDQLGVESTVSEGFYALITKEAVKDLNQRIREKLEWLHTVDLFLNHPLDFTMKSLCIYSLKKFMQEVTYGVYLLKLNIVTYDKHKLEIKCNSLSEDMKVLLLEEIKNDNIDNVVELSNVLCLFKQAYLDILEGDENKYHKYIDIYDRF
ncbi:hypothetical protein ACQUY5_27135 [Bacillus cereus]|uniref:hypothetical protein n=1 Tax=Bacillus cereus TaxID=1396 RepID=UPI003D1863DD